MLFRSNVLHAASELKYRDFLTVVLICKDQDAFNDNWIYIHEPNIKVGRIQNFKSWSPFMVPDPNMACYGLEYFCFEGDGLWTSSNEDLIKLGTKEIIQIGLTKLEAVVDGYVVRQPKAYPVYDYEYKDHLEVIREAIKEYKGLYLVGRNGMHKYNNQDHLILMGMLAADQILTGKSHELWSINTDYETYQETCRIDQSGLVMEA